MTVLRGNDGNLGPIAVDYATSAGGVALSQTRDFAPRMIDWLLAHPKP